MSEMVERVAKAITAAHFERKEWHGACSKAQYVQYRTEREWRTFEPAARLAIAAMREPTKAMLSIGQDEIEFHVPDAGNPCRPHPHASAEAWNVMIDEALK